MLSLAQKSPLTVILNLMFPKGDIIMLQNKSYVEYFHMPIFLACDLITTSA